jgi:hypothetical protein
MKNKVPLVLTCLSVAWLTLVSFTAAKTAPISKHNKPLTWKTPMREMAALDTTMMTSHYIVGEKPSGSVNGTNKVFTVAHAPLTGKDQVYLNGILQTRGSDYTISSSTITFTTAPATGDVIRVIYYY